MSRAARIRVRRRQVQRNRRLVTLGIVLLIFVMVFILCHNFHVRAQKPASYKYYTEIRVGRDDTFWNIAERYMTEEYRSASEYIRELKEINNLGLELPYGRILLVPYYSEEIK